MIARGFRPQGGPRVAACTGANSRWPLSSRHGSWAPPEAPDMCYFINAFPQSCEIGSVVITPISYVSKWRHREGYVTCPGSRRLEVAEPHFRSRWFSAGRRLSPPLPAAPTEGTEEKGHLRLLTVRGSLEDEEEHPRPPSSGRSVLAEGLAQAKACQGASV